MAPGYDADSSDDETVQANPAPAREDPNQGLPALFWDAMPENPEEHPDWVALQALRDECTPQERANNFKTQGNNKLNVGLKANNKELLREAVEFYTKGLAEKCGDAPTDAVILCNRAHVQSLLGNWRSALDDAQAAQQLDPTNAKAYFRGARAALRLGRYEVCQQLCEQGRQVDPKAAPEFDKLSQEAAGCIARAQAETARQQAAKDAQLAPARALADAICRRKYQVTLPQIRAQNDWRPAWDTSSGGLTWPVVILYPEGATQDEIQAWEEGDTLKDQLDMMFAPDAPPMEWDTQGQYKRDTVELYYLSWAGKPLSRTQLLQVLATGNWPDTAEGVLQSPSGGSDKCVPQWVRVKESWSLHELLSQPDFIIPGVPLLAAVAKGTEYKGRFLARNAEM